MPLQTAFSPIDQDVILSAFILGWKLSHVAFRNLNQQQNTTGLSFQPNNWTVSASFHLAMEMLSLDSLKVK